MIVTEKQLLILLQSTMDTLTFCDTLGVFKYPHDTRRRIVEEVVNQQKAALTARSDCRHAWTAQGFCALCGDPMPTPQKL